MQDSHQDRRPEDALGFVRGGKKGQNYDETCCCGGERILGNSYRRPYLKQPPREYSVMAAQLFHTRSSSGSTYPTGGEQGLYSIYWCNMGWGQVKQKKALRRLSQYGAHHSARMRPRAPAPVTPSPGEVDGILENGTQGWRLACTCMCTDEGEKPCQAAVQCR